MLFNSLQFALFFSCVYVLYILLNFKWQNRLLLIASYIFYCAWDWRFSFLIIISTLIDYYCGLQIKTNAQSIKRKIFLSISIFANLLILGFFKYFNFFAESLQSLFIFWGFSTNYNLVHFVLPVGISFYTFQSMSYTIDIYRKELNPTRSLEEFALYVAFFPQLVAGPIERAKRLLPQIQSPRTLSLSKFYQGSYLIFWGLFQKIFVADNLAPFVDSVFSSTAPYNGPLVLLALYAFAFQIFCDFAGYSNIARGLGKVMGFDIMINFRLPYFSKDPREFWQRWHISLSTWLRDYLYIPLGGNQKGKLKIYRNLSITMLLGGLWHGANWTFVFWGLYQAVLLIIYRIFSGRKQQKQFVEKFAFNRLLTLLQGFFFFHLVCLGWLIFRAESLSQIFYMLKSFFCNQQIVDDGLYIKAFFEISFFISFILIIQIFQFIKNDLNFILKLNFWIRGIIYFLMFYLMLMYGVTGGKEFVYFQF